MKRLLWLLAGLQVSCGGGATGPTVSSLQINGDAPSAAGRTSQLTATSVLSDGSRRDVTALAAWRSERPEIATVSSSGLVTALTWGQVDVTATYEGASGTQTLMIPERLFIAFADPIGDSVGRVDVTLFVIDFDASTGEYRIEIRAESPAPFLGTTLVNINMFNADLGTRAQDPPFFQDTGNLSFEPTPVTSILLAGVDTRLTHWRAGDFVALSSLPLGNPENVTFFSSVVADSPRPPDARFGENLDFIALGAETTIRRR